MTTPTASSTSIPWVPTQTKLQQPAWWVHILAVALAAVAFVAGVIHPGYHLPTWVSASVGVGAFVLASASTVVILIVDHRLKLNPTAAAGYLHDIQTWATQVRATLNSSGDPVLQAFAGRLATAQATSSQALALAQAVAGVQTASTPPTAPTAPVTPAAAPSGSPGPSAASAATAS